MSVHISVSTNNDNKNSKGNKCNDILQKLIKHDINCRSINTTSVVDENIEQGCLLTFGISNNSKNSVNKIWNIINNNNEYTCSHLNIEGIYSGCILDYINCNNCPGAINN
jgi:hypothetical protein